MLGHMPIGRQFLFSLPLVFCLALFQSKKPCLLESDGVTEELARITINPSSCR
jgi:hypothetical protein